jgi:hypothetical protein
MDVSLLIVQSAIKLGSSGDNRLRVVSGVNNDTAPIVIDDACN